MKGKVPSGNNPDRDDWRTPSDLWNTLNSQYEFNFDCCADEETNKTLLYSSNFERTESRDLVNKVSWMNPPFSKSKEMFEHFFRVVNKGVAIYRCDNMETKIWQNLIFKKASWIFIPNRRVQYKKVKGGGVPFPSALIGFNVEPVNNIEGINLEVSK